MKQGLINIWHTFLIAIIASSILLLMASPIFLAIHFHIMWLLLFLPLTCFIGIIISNKLSTGFWFKFDF